VCDCCIFPFISATTGFAHIVMGAFQVALNDKDDGGSTYRNGKR